jgi:hypothetical protein
MGWTENRVASGVRAFAGRWLISLNSIHDRSTSTVGEHETRFQRWAVWVSESWGWKPRAFMRRAVGAGGMDADRVESGGETFRGMIGCFVRMGFFGSMRLMN